MKNIRKYTTTNKIFISIALAGTLAGCATKLKSSTWVPIRESSVPFEQAIAKCEYDLRILGKENDRLKFGLLGLQHPTFEACMKVQGYEWMKIEDAEAKLQGSSVANVKENSNKDADAIKIAEYRAGVEKGDANAEVNLAWRYYSGTGVAQSFTQAYKLYARAAEKVSSDKQSASNAQINLGTMYVSGNGVEVDSIRAMMWFELSGINGSEDGKKRYADLSSKSNPMQVLKAKRLKNYCLAKEFKSCDEPLSKDWKICEVTNVFAASPEKAKIVSDLNLNFAFQRQQNSETPKLYIFVSNSQYRSRDLVKTGAGLLNNKDRYVGYVAKDKNAAVQEFEDGNLSIRLTDQDGNDMSFFTTCSN